MLTLCHGPLIVVIRSTISDCRRPSLEAMYQLQRHAHRVPTPTQEIYYMMFTVNTSALLDKGTRSKALQTGRHHNCAQHMR